MICFDDKVSSSKQKLEQILQQYAVLDGFQSTIKNRLDSDISNEIIQTILSEIERFLVYESDCEIDQVSGRIETKLAKIGAEGVSISDESLEKIKQKLFKAFPNKSDMVESDIISDKQVKDDLDDNIHDEDEIENNNEDDEDEKQSRNKSDTAEVLFDILNNINKDEKLKDFKEFLVEISPKHKQYSVFKWSITAKTLDEILPKVKFFKHFQKKIEKLAVKSAKPLLKMAAKVEKYQKKFEEIHENLTKNLMDLVKKTLRLTVEIFKLAGTNIVLAGSYLILAASKIVLAASNIILALSNIVIILARIILLSAVILFTIGIMSAVVIFIAAIVLSIGICIALAFGAIVATTILVVATLLAMTVLVVAAVIAAFVLTVGSSLIMSACMIAGAMILSVVGLISTLPVIASIILAGLILFAASIAGGLVLSAAALLLTSVILGLAGIFAMSISVWSASLVSAVSGIFGLAFTISSSVILLASVFTAGLMAQLALSMILINLSLALTIAFWTSAIMSAIAILMATAATLTLVLLLGLFVVLILGFIYLRDRIIEELKKTTLYDWWTKDVAKAGGLWEWIKGWFLKQWPWLEDIWGYIKECVIDAFHNTWIYIWWVDEIEAAGGLWSWIKYRLASVWDWMTNLPTRIWNNLYRWMRNTWSDLYDFGKIFINALNKWWESSSIKECLDSILNWLVTAKDRLINGAQKAVDTAGNAMTFGLVNGYKDIGNTYDKTTQELADMNAQTNKYTNDFVKNTSIDKLDSEIDRLQNLWQNASTRGGESGLVYAEALGKLRRKRNHVYLDAALNLLAANSMDLTELINKRDYIKKWRNTYRNVMKNGANRYNEAMDTVKKLDARISGIQDGTIKVDVPQSGLDEIENQRRGESINVPDADSLKASEKKRRQKLDDQANAMESIGTAGKSDNGSKYKPVPVPVPQRSQSSLILMR